MLWTGWTPLVHVALVVTHDQIGDGSSISRYAEAGDGR